MKQFYPNKFIYSGDIAKAKTLFGPGKSQMNILKQFNSFQDLNQGIRKLWLNAYSYVECIRIYNQNIIKIHVIPEYDSKKETRIEPKYLLLLVYGYGETKLEIANKLGDYELGEEIYYYDDVVGVLNYISGSNLLYGSFGGIRDYGLNLIGLSSEATADLISCLKRHYQRKYQTEEKLVGKYNVIAQEILNEIKLDTALDISPVGNQLCEDTGKHVLKEWTKTYDDLIVTAYMYFSIETLQTLWGITVSYKNHPVTILGKAFFDGLIRMRPFESLGTLSHTHSGFDIWLANNTEGKLTYYVGVMADSGYFISFRLNKETLNLEEEYTCNSNIRYSTDTKFYAFDEYIRELHIFLLGYGHSDGKDYAWWGMPNFNIGGGFSKYYYRENLFTGTFEEFEINLTHGSFPHLVSAIWHPVERKLYPIGESNYYNTETGDSFSFTYNFDYYCVRNPAAGTAYCEGTNAPATTWWFWEDRDPPESSTTQFNFTFTFLGITHFYAGYYYNAATNYPTYLVSTHWSATSEVEEYVLDYGALMFGEDILNKGTIQNFAISDGSWDGNDASVGTGFTSFNFYSSYSECRPDSVKRFDIQKLAWDNNGGIVYEYLVDQMTTEENDEGDIICVWEDVWTSVTSGSSKILDGADFNFPHDFNWEAILLSGTDSNNTLHETDTIYIDSNGKFFTQDSYGQIYEIGKYDRAFFTQYDLDIEKEV